MTSLIFITLAIIIRFPGKSKYILLPFYISTKKNRNMVKKNANLDDIKDRIETRSSNISHGSAVDEGNMSCRLIATCPL